MRAAYDGPVVQHWDLSQLAGDPGASVYPFEPISAFVRRLKAEVPVDIHVTCERDDDGDDYVVLAVPSVAWELHLGEVIGAVTLEILQEHGVYVGLVTIVESKLDGWGEPRGVG